MRYLPVLALVLGACGPNDVADAGDGGHDASDTGVDGATDGSTDADADDDDDRPVGDADQDTSPGEPWSYAGDELALSVYAAAFTDERLCDLDGNGTADNSFADLGAGTSALAASVYGGLLGSLSETGTGLGWLLPATSDGGPPGLILVAGEGAQLDSGLHAPSLGLDHCGEPRSVFEEATVVAGDLIDGHGAVPAPLGRDLVPTLGELSGSFVETTAGVSARLTWCLYVSIGDAGAARGPAFAGDLSLLEVLLGGGSVFGASGVPGLRPDIDVDGDGLETVELDGDGRVTRCIDGDRTVISGADCWSDDRLADGFSLVMTFEAIQSTFAGRAPGWAGCCETPYPEPSRFGADWTAPTRARQVVAGGGQTCLLTEDGAVRCWGYNETGQLGCGTAEPIGDDEPASAGCVVDLGGRVVQLAGGFLHTCALLEGGRVRCWGLGDGGRLGYGNTDTIGDDESPASAGDVDVGGTVLQVDVGGTNTCAVLEGGRLRCWGGALFGQLGHGDVEPIGDDETPASAGDIDVGGRVLQVAVGGGHVCALLEDGFVRCWGDGSRGQLGHGDVETIGDDEAPASAGPVDVGGPVARIASGRYNTCALRTDGQVFCWGEGIDGQLGNLSSETIGDDETPALAGPVDVGGPAVDVLLGPSHACVLLEGGGVRCWGSSLHGPLGYGDMHNVGDDETPASVGDIDVGGTVVALSSGKFYNCAIMADLAVRCWGSGADGQLGYGTMDAVGDDETPASAGDVPVFDCGD